MSSADRVKRHREKRKRMDLQLAVGIAKIVLGSSAGEQRKAVVEALERACADEDISEEYRSMISRAVNRLTAT